ncbi:hypothetical protein IAG25_38935 [Caballeronia sp. EK]|uniref:hypothetical protein n=1 Tax=Caballeronia sp. EK TaxID=2767469 RepID=UPI0016563D31|nr:hypothetical protein [Caballeronia sp. EK]MBC8642778.1 hypothetical protein [Caballeronia sp. EK]
MQTFWAREPYALNVQVQDFQSAVIEPTRPITAGFVAVVSISLSSMAAPVFPPLMLGDDSGNAFDNESAALSAGVDAANRMLDDLLA